MPKFQYSAKNNEGHVIAGVLDNSSPDALIAELRRKNYYITGLSEVDESKRDLREMLKSKITVRDLSIFCTQFASILSAGVPLVTALEVIRSQTSSKQLRKILIDVYDQVQRGFTLSQAFGTHRNRFPELFISMIEAGEMSGSMDQAFTLLGATFQKDYKLSSKIKSSMAYPAVLVGVSILVLVFLLTTVVPTFVSMYTSSGVEIPAPTRIILAISGFFNSYWYAILISGVLMVGAVWYALSTPKGRLRFDRMKLRLPIFGSVNLKVISARFARAMATLSASGVPILSALDVTSRAVGNKFVGSGVLKVQEDVRLGMNVSEPLETLGIFPPLVTHMIRLGEEADTFDEMMARTAEFYEDESDLAMTRLASLIEPFIILLLGGMILFIVLAVMVPMFGIYGMIG